MAKRFWPLYTFWILLGAWFVRGQIIFYDMFSFHVFMHDVTCSVWFHFHFDFTLAPPAAAYQLLLPTFWIYLPVLYGSLVLWLQHAPRDTYSPFLVEFYSAGARYRTPTLLVVQFDQLDCNTTMYTVTPAPPAAWNLYMMAGIYDWNGSRVPTNLDSKNFRL